MTVFNEPLPDEAEAWQLVVNGCRDWRNAQRLVDEMVTREMPDTRGNMGFFSTMTSKVLPVLLHAAAVMDGEDMRRVRRWIHRINDDNVHREIDSILRWKENVDPLDIWIGFMGRESKLRGDIIATVDSLLVSVHKNGSLLGSNPIAYRRLAGLDGAAEVEDLRRMLALYRRMPDSRGGFCLARDARVLTWGPTAGQAERLHLEVEAAFHGVETSALREQILDGVHTLRSKTPLPDLDSETAVQMHVERRRQVPTLVIVSGEAGAQARRDLLAELVADPQRAWTCPVLILDATDAPMGEDEQDAVTHLVEYEGATALASAYGTAWYEPAYWDDLRVKEHEERERPARELAKRLAEVEARRAEREAAALAVLDAPQEQSPADPEAASDPLKLLLDQLAPEQMELTEKGQDLVRKGLGLALDLDIVHAPRHLVAMLAAQERFGAEFHGGYTPLVIEPGMLRSLKLSPRHVPTPWAAKQLALGAVDAVAWAHVSEAAQDRPITEAYREWTRGSRATQVGEVLMWRVELGDLVTGSGPSLLVLQPTGRGLPR